MLFQISFQEANLFWSPGAWEAGWGRGGLHPAIRRARWALDSNARRAMARRTLKQKGAQWAWRLHPSLRPSSRFRPQPPVKFSVPSSCP